ncbi:MAG TPA: GTPase Era [Actinobacteria bacterium]|nr:GTPase Era [Actinomycetota bacterium]
MSHRSGFACIVGRPNTGKSTLTNALVGQKVAITSSRPQTTRHAIRGIVTVPQAQLVLVDTPGVHRPRTLLGQRLNDLVRESWADVDVLTFCVPADEKPGPGDRFILRELESLTRTPKIAVVTKCDRVDREQLAAQLLAVQELGRECGIEWDEIVPISAVRGEQIDLLRDLLIARLPEGPELFPDGQLSDDSQDQRIAELIREAALEGVRDELPHSLAVVVQEVCAREDRPAARPLTDVSAVLFVERESQKAIVIGRAGARLKQVGTAARTQIEAIVGTPVHLDLRVKVAKDWQRDPKQLRRLGF